MPLDPNDPEIKAGLDAIFDEPQPKPAALEPDTETFEEMGKASKELVDKEESKVPKAIDLSTWTEMGKVSDEILAKEEAKTPKTIDLSVMKEMATVAAQELPQETPQSKASDNAFWKSQARKQRLGKDNLLDDMQEMGQASAEAFQAEQPKVHGIPPNKTDILSDSAHEIEAEQVRKSIDLMEYMKRTFAAQADLMAKMVDTLATHERKLMELDGLLERSRL